MSLQKRVWTWKVLFHLMCLFVVWLSVTPCLPGNMVDTAYAADASADAATTAAIDVPLTIQELLPRGVPSTGPRTQVVSLGVPLPTGHGLGSAQELGLSGSRAAQFAPLQFDANTGELRWVRVTFLAEPAQGPYRVLTGSGDFGGGALATEQPDRILVDTGTAQFEVRRSGFHGIDRAVVGGQERVSPHALGGVVVLAAGVRYESARDTASETVLEQNGPVRAVVRSRGVLRDASGGRHLGYTVRLTFDRESAAVGATVTLRNGELASLSAKTFDAAWFEVPVALNGTATVSFGINGVPVGGSLAAGQTAFLLQGDTNYRRSPRTDRIVPELTPSVGVAVDLAGQSLHAGGNLADRADGWMQVSDAGHAVFAGMRDMAIQFPSGFEVTDGLLAVQLFPRQNPKTGLVFSWGAHETRELLLAFGPAGDDPIVWRESLQHPLLARCSLEHYRDTGAIFGETRLVSEAEQQQFFADQGHAWSAEDPADTDIEFKRQYSFSTTGGGNQFDQSLTRLLDWLRTGSPGQFAQARLDVQWKADQAVEHSDDFDYGTRQRNVSDVDVAQPVSFHARGARSVFDDEHPHWVCLPVYWLLTGDDRIREASQDYAEYRRYRAGHPTYGPIWGGGTSHMRLWSRAFRDVALYWEMSGDPRSLEDLRRMVDVLLDTIEQGTSRGRNLERGYWYFGDETDATRYIHLFFLTEIQAMAVHHAWRVLPDDDPRKEDLGDYLTGLAYFTLVEAQVSPQAIGYPYGYLSAVANTELGTRGDQTGRLFTWGYEHTGDMRFAERARSFAWRVIDYQHDLRGSELATHARIHVWNERDNRGAVLLEPTVQANGDGSYTLGWTAPAEALSYQVKYGPRTMVENLEFDQMNRTYAHDPSQVMNFWAATNVQGEPTPGPQGTQETWTTPVLPAGTWHFAVKALVGHASNTTPPPPTPTVSGFQASEVSGGVRLYWSLSASTLSQIDGVAVQRTTASTSQWEQRTVTPLTPASTMTWDDDTVLVGETYSYRLVLLQPSGAQVITTAVDILVQGSTGTDPGPDPDPEPDADGPAAPTTLATPYDKGSSAPVEIRYTLSTETFVDLRVYDIRGRLVRVLRRGTQAAGAHVVDWDKTDRFHRGAVRGVYFVHLRTRDTSMTRKLVLIRR